MGSKGGQLLTFESDDLLHWRYKGVFFDGLDVMPECVDLFSLNNTDMVILSLIGNPGTQYPHNRPTVLIMAGLIGPTQHLQSLDAIRLIMALTSMRRRQPKRRTDVG